MTSKRNTMSVVPGLAVYILDNQSVWLKGKVLTVEDDKCTVAVLHTEVYDYYVETF